MKLKNLISLVSILFFISCYSLQGQTQKSIKETLVTYSYNDIDTAIDYYKKLKSEHPQTYNFNEENELNSLGYQLLSDNRIEDAIKIFELLVAEFPNAFNPYDSLGEAYFLNGNTEQALQNYKKSLDLNPKNENAERFILNHKFKNRDKNKFYKTYTKQQYVADLDELANNLVTVNPFPYKFTTKEKFWNVVEEKKSLLTNNTTYSEFIWLCSELIANINCGHSAIPMYFEQESEMLPDTLRFPMELLNINGRLYIADALINKHKVKAGTEIVSINGKNSAEIIEDVNKHIATQGKVGNVAKKHLFNWRSTAMIPYSLGFPENYKITIKGNKKPIALDMLDGYEFGLKNLRTCKKTFCLDFLEENENIAIITFQHWDFYGNRFSIIQNFIDESFQKIKEKNSKTLIIDVRGNGGGNSSVTAYLLQYLAKKPFTYFKAAPPNSPKLKPLSPFNDRFNGNVYFLSDGRSGSSTGQLLALAKHHNMGTIIGEESNGGIFYTGGQKMFSLTHTNLFYYIGRFTHITDADSISDERGVYPDHYCTQTIEDYLKGVDTVMNYTLKLITKE